MSHDWWCAPSTAWADDALVGGWSARVVAPYEDVVLIGRPATKGCFTACLRGGGVSIMVYEDEMPDDVVNLPNWQEDRDELVPATPGWALEFIRIIEAGV